MLLRCQKHLKQIADMKVREIFYSIQGEGARQGTASIFIRLSNCNLNCWFCDTDWSTGEEMTVEEIKIKIEKYPCKEIVWTGGEPTLQLTNEILKQFEGYYHCIESNGTNEIPSLIDYIVVAPKDALIHSSLLRIKINEVRIPLSTIDKNPDIKDYPQANNYFVSPLFLGKKKQRFELDMNNVNSCIQFVKNNPEWKLSLQVHKLINIR